MLVYFSLPLIGCEYFRIKSIVVNDDDPVAVFPSSFIFFSSSYLWEFSIDRYVNVSCMRNVWEKMTINPLHLWSRDGWVCMCIRLVTDMLCHKRNVYLHIRNVKSMCRCMFCSESNCLLKSRYVSSNPLRYYHQSVYVPTRELTSSFWTCQTAWFL